MEKGLFINKLDKMRLIAHRLGYQMTKYPENSLEVLECIFKNENLLNACNGFEFDVCFTKDHIPIVTHDKYIDDISDNHGLIREYTFDEIKKFNFKFRKSLHSDNDFITYKVITLEKILTFFENNIDLLGDKIIKIETKDYVFTNKSNINTKNLTELANIINKFPKLNKNIVHLSFWPLNLKFLKKIQKKKNYELVKNDFLCDYSILVFLTRFMPYLDNISLRIKTSKLAQEDKDNSKIVNKKIKADLFWMQFANAINEKNLKYAINKYGSVNLFALNDYDEIDTICSHISDEFFRDNFRNIIITTNNPFYLRNIK